MDNDQLIDMEPFFLEDGPGPLFCMRLGPRQGRPRAQILYLHPFAEEMNKSRRMAALQARQLAAKGYEVLQVDLTGCGDSWGDFGDATWQRWQADGMLAADWLRRRAPSVPLVLWGLRLGASLAVEIGENRSDVAALLLWQPVTDGDLFLNQFLRLKQMSDMLSERSSRASVKSYRAQLLEGQPVEVGGYLLSPELALGIANLQLKAAKPRKAVWIELISSPDLTASAASLETIDHWRGCGCNVDLESVSGEPFWSTQEISTCPELIEKNSSIIKRLAQ
ncbi:hydrolase, exosortase system type 1 associated [Thiorhodococcus drewsii AZ1]|uniref:Hydrolase, exosortase system type 1 associated n=1 Tax=Thiorhodococcus drewsii AZ1 TaxID=765913 RepID=G2E600_9GAMM|nr:hydrolase 2, exosortase A system-associated [Thiorhodococcus drewsii]EGV28485.1 hydrolase, exosortase system type 1 associated [Thiorhodococcus drewsii AZ1]